MTKYKKCMDCEHFENRCYEKYVKKPMVIGICNKYHCCTSPERTCLDHKKHNHRNYEPELKK